MPSGHSNLQQSLFLHLKNHVITRFSEAISAGMDKSCPKEQNNIGLFARINVLTINGFLISTTFFFKTIFIFV